MVFLAAVGLAAPARAQEVAPIFDGLEAGPTPLETYKLNALAIVSHEVSSTSLFGGTSKWWRPVRGLAVSIAGRVGVSPAVRGILPRIQQT